MSRTQNPVASLRSTACVSTIRKKERGNPDGFDSRVYLINLYVERRFRALSKNFRVIAVDLKGFGFSGKPDDDYTRRAQGQLVVHLLDSLKIEKAWLVGNSMGGEVALERCPRKSATSSRLILIDSAGVAVKGSGSLAPAYVRIPLVGRVLTALALTSDKLVREGLEKSFYDRLESRAERVAHYIDRSEHAVANWPRYAHGSSGAFPIEQDLGRVNSRTLIFGGRKMLLFRWQQDEK